MTNFQKISDTKKNIKYIVHLADIHIRRTTERTTEYMEVFKNLIDDLNITKPVFVVSYKNGIGFDAQFSEEEFNYLYRVHTLNYKKSSSFPLLKKILLKEEEENVSNNKGT